MTEKTKDSIYHILVLIVIVLGFVLVVQMITNYDNKHKQPKVSTDTIFVTDTLYQPKLDSIEITKYKTIYLPSAPDTITKDSIVIDTFLVEVPISKYEIDTTLPNQANLKAELEGFGVEMNKLSITYPKVATTTEKRQRNKRWGLGINAGYSLCTDGNKIMASPTIGVGISYNIFRF